MYLCFGKCVNVCDSVYICEVSRGSPTRSFAHVLNKREKKKSLYYFKWTDVNGSTRLFY